MAVELLRYHNFDQQTAIREATSAGLVSMDYINRQLDCREITDLTVSKFSKVISALNRTGHARFRRAPVLLPQTQSPPLNPVQCSIQASGSNQPQTLNLCSVSPASEAERAPATAVQPLKIDVIDKEALSLSSAERDPPPPVQPLKIDVIDKKALSLSAAVTTSGNSSSTVVSTITGDGSVSKGKGRLPSTFLASVISSGKPPLPGKRYREHDHNITGKTSGSSPCHCKKRKHLMKRTIRVPSISSKVADIPPDENSWRKYGQKPVNGSSYPRGYYKCSTVTGCPARKHVERANDDPTMLIVTYEGEHRHTQAAKQGITAAWAGSRVAQLKLAKF